MGVTSHDEETGEGGGLIKKVMENMLKGGCGLDMCEGSSTIMVCTDYCDSWKKSFRMVASRNKTSKIFVNDS